MAIWYEARMSQFVSNQDALQYLVYVAVNDDILLPGLVEEKTFQLFLHIVEMDFDSQTFAKFIGVSGIIFFCQLLNCINNACCCSHLFHLQIGHRKHFPVSEV